MTRISEDYRAHTETEFRRQLAPLLDLGQRDGDATDLFIDGDQIVLNYGDRRLIVGWDQLPGVTVRSIQAAAATAAVFGGHEFGAEPPAKPYVSVKMPPDLRVTVTCPPASDRWHMAIRFLRSRHLALQDYVTQGVMEEPDADRLATLMRTHKNIVISGGTGAGKTTLLRAMLDLAVEADERIVVIEDTPELSLAGANVVHLHTTLQVSMADLLRLTLRMNPDRIVLGEVRGPEALELVRAMNTGHDGTLCTLHSNGAEDALRRLHTLVMEGQPTFPLDGIRSAVDEVVHLRGRGQGRRLAPIWTVDK